MSNQKDYVIGAKSGYTDENTYHIVIKNLAGKGLPSALAFHTAIGLLKNMAESNGTDFFDMLEETMKHIDNMVTTTEISDRPQGEVPEPSLSDFAKIQTGNSGNVH